MITTNKNYKAAVLLTALTLPSLAAVGCSENSNQNPLNSAASDLENSTENLNGGYLRVPALKLPSDLEKIVLSSKDEAVRQRPQVNMDSSVVTSFEYEWNGYKVVCLENKNLQGNSQNFYSIEVYSRSPGSELEFPVDSDARSLDAEKLFNIMQTKSN